MSIKISGKEANIHWLSDKHNNGSLVTGQGILYLTADNHKFGQATSDAYKGLTPDEVFEKRYSGKKDRLLRDWIAQDIIVFNNVSGERMDDRVRKNIFKYHSLGLIPFSANVGRKQKKNTNREALIDYCPKRDLPTLLKIIKQTLGIETYFDTRNPIKWRHLQDEDVKNLCRILTTEMVALYAAYTGRGKTIIAIETVSRIIDKGGVVLVTTPQTSTADSFKENIEKYHFGPNRARKITYMDSDEFSKHSVDDIRRRADVGELIFIVLTVQNVRWTKDRKMREKYYSLSGKIDFWIRDERHEQYEGLVTKQILRPIEAKYILDLTATPYNVYDQYKDSQVYVRSLLWAIYNRNVTNVPKMYIESFFTPFTKVSPKIVDLYSKEEGFDPRKLFVRKNKNFVMGSEIIEIFKLMYSSKLSKNKNPFSVVNDTDLSEVSKQVFLTALPEGQSGDGAAEYIPALAKMLNAVDELGIFFISSYDVETNAKKENLTISNYIENLKKNKKSRICILTCGKFLTGADIPCIGHILLFVKVNSVTLFSQIMGRAARVYPDKEAVKIYSFAPGTEIALTFGQMAKLSSNLDPSFTEKQLLDCIPLTEYGDGGLRRIDAAEILEITEEHCKSLSKDKLPSVALEDVLIKHKDLSAWENLNIKKFKNSNIKIVLNDKNGAKVRDVVKLSSGRVKKEEMTNIENIAATLQAIMVEAKWVCYSTNNYDYSKVLANPVLRKMFSDEIIDAAIHTIEKSDALKSLIKYNFEKKKLAYKNSTDEESVYDDVFLNNVYKRSLGLVYLPFSEAKKIVNKLPAHLNRKGVNILVWNALSGTFAILLKKKFPKANIVCAEYFDYFKNHLKRSGFATPEVNKNFVIDNSSNCDIFKSKDYKNMKFDVIVGNPPYQMKRGDSDATIAIWDRFVLESFQLLKSGGYLAMIHPSGWRNASGRFTETRDLLLSRHMEYLEIHSERDGVDLFGVSTRYDWYVLKNIETSSNITTVKFEDNNVENVNLNELPFVPNHSYNRIKNLIATSEEEPIEILHSYSAYFTRGKAQQSKNHVQWTQSNTNKYPVIYHVNKDESLSIAWSSDNTKGHYGVPKLVWIPNAQGTGYYLDLKGKYALSNFAMGIVDTPSNLKKIYKVFHSQEFRKLMSATFITFGGIDKRTLSTFRKDFWKDFL
jgi:superfamily II DNA or RNA helicase